jgi:6,7-dimethyl-8-ribityllumazine synthase
VAQRSHDPAASASLLDGAGLRVGIVQARWNAQIGEVMLSQCRARLAQLGVAAEATTVVSVPGSLEIALCLQKMAQSGAFDALIAFGAVIRGETYHFEIVANESAAGITSVQLETGVPIANGILTTDTEQQAQQRAQTKGSDCAEVAVEMANLLRTLERARRL